MGKREIMTLKDKPKIIRTWKGWTTFENEPRNMSVIHIEYLR